MKKLLPLLALLSLHFAQALSLVVLDEGVTPIGYGEVVGSRLFLKVPQNYSGKVVVVFSKDDGEQNLYSGLQTRYDAELRGGQLQLITGKTTQTLSKLLTNYKLQVESVAPNQKKTDLVPKDKPSSDSDKESKDKETKEKGPKEPKEPKGPKTDKGN